MAVRQGLPGQGFQARLQMGRIGAAGRVADNRHDHRKRADSPMGVIYSTFSRASPGPARYPTHSPAT